MVHRSTINQVDLAPIRSLVVLVSCERQCSYQSVDQLAWQSFSVKNDMETGSNITGTFSINITDVKVCNNIFLVVKKVYPIPNKFIPIGMILRNWISACSFYWTKRQLKKDRSRGERGWWVYDNSLKTDGMAQACGWVWGLIVYLLQWP